MRAQSCRLGLAFSNRWSVSDDWHDWPSLYLIFFQHRFQGVKTSRDSFLVDVDLLIGLKATDLQITFSS